LIFRTVLFEYVRSYILKLTALDFSDFLWLTEWEPKTAHLTFMTWVFGSRFWRGIPLWIRDWVL